MNLDEYIKQLEKELAAIRRTLYGIHRHDLGLQPRDSTDHTGYIVQSKKVSDVRVRQGTKDLKNAYTVDYETSYTESTFPILALRPRIESDLAALAASGEYEGDTPPRLYETRFTLPRGGERWVVTAIFDKEFCTKTAINNNNHKENENENDI